MTHQRSLGGYENLSHMLALAADQYHDRAAFRYKIQGGKIQEITFKQVHRDVQSLATALLDEHMLPGHVALIGENSYPWVVTYLAVVCGGGVIVPIDKELPENEMRHILNEADVHAVVYSKTYEGSISGIRQDCPTIHRYICMQEEMDTQGGKSWDGMVNTGKALLSNGCSSFDEVTLDPDKMCSLIYTSGTTGVSKGVMLSHANLVAVMQSAAQTNQVHGIVLSVLPMHHTYEFTLGVLTMLSLGVTICINDSLKHFAGNLKLFKPTDIFLVPLFVETMFKRIWDEAKKKKKDKLMVRMIRTSNHIRKVGIDLRRKLFKSIHETFGGSLQLIMCGGAPLSAYLMKGFRDLGILLLNGYGITECAPLVAGNRNTVFRDGSVGLPMPCCSIRIDRMEGEEDGEILVKGKNVMLGYYKNEAATREVMADGWFRTGDLGKFDQDGFLYITGRKKNLIVLKNGKNVYPEEIEGYIASIPYIKEVVVYAEESRGSETGLIADVYPDLEYSQSMSPEDFMKILWQDVDRINQGLPVYKRISNILIRETEFVKTTTKKIKRFMLQGDKGSKKMS